MFGLARISTDSPNIPFISLPHDHFVFIDWHWDGLAYCREMAQLIIHCECSKRFMSPKFPI